MDESARIGLITGVASIAGGFVSQFIGIYFQGRMNSLERARMIEARSSQLYLREIEAYDEMVPALGRLLYVARDLSRDPILREPHSSHEQFLNSYQRIQNQVREAVEGHLVAAAKHYHVIGPAAVERIDAAGRQLFATIDELTAVVAGKTPLTKERALEIWDQLEDLRLEMLDFCWSSLDVQHLEGSFQKLKGKDSGERQGLPSILKERFDEDA